MRKEKRGGGVSRWIFLMEGHPGPLWMHIKILYALLRSLVLKINARSIKRDGGEKCLFTSLTFKGVECGRVEGDL